MKYIAILIFLMLCACKESIPSPVSDEVSNHVEVSDSDLVANIEKIIEANDETMVVTYDQFSYQTDVILVGERIDGPANIRDEKDGELIFELSDRALIQIEDGDEEWVHISAHCWLEGAQFQSGEIPANSILYDHNHDTIGKTFAVIESWAVDNNQTEGYAYFEGYTHKNNIRPESLIENDLVSFIAENGRKQIDYKPFSEKYRMRGDNRHLDFEGIYIYENWITDPSPGYRVNLLFLDDELKGVIHSRDLEILNTTTYDLGRDNDRVSFFNDYPKQDQLEFVSYMTDWLMTVD